MKSCSLILLAAALAGCRPAPPPAETAPAQERRVKEAEVAGQFYAADGEELAAELKLYLDAAGSENDGTSPVAIFTPHAGYAYSGAVAGAAYARLRGRAPDVIVILAPSHYHAGAGVAVPSCDSFRTPLGEVPVAADYLEDVRSRCDVVRVDDAPFEKEHAVEVQLPFIQTLAAGAKIAPFIFLEHDAVSARRVGDALAAAARNAGDVVYVCSVDLSHYHPYDDAVRLDGEFVKAFESFDASAIWGGNGVDFEIDAPGPVAATFAAAKAAGATEARALVVKNSGDVTGDTSSGVVGYFAGVISRPGHGKSDGDYQE